jgi:hypothetical protein
MSWKLFSYTWNDATAGEHTIVSRAIDANGHAQAEKADETKKTIWENPEQMPRRVMIS